MKIRLAVALISLALSGGAIAGPTLSVLYKRDSAQSVERTDTAVQSALVAFEQELIDRGVEVIAPDAKTYEVLDRAPGSIVTFAPDAGLSLLVDAVKTTRPSPGTDRSFAEVRMRARLFHGRRVLASVAGSGQIEFRAGSEDKAFEAAAKRAVGQVIGGVMTKLDQNPDIAGPAKLDADSFQPPPTAQPAAPLPKPQKIHALLIGVSDFSMVRKINPRAGVDDLKGVIGDVQLVRRTLQDIGVADKQIKVLVNKDATVQGLRQALSALTAAAGADDLVVFFIASHGMPKNEGVTGFGYPVLYDTKLNDKAGLIDFEEIRNSLVNLPAKRVVWVADTCHSGGAALGLPVVEISTRAIRVRPVNGLSTRAAAMEVKEKDLAVLSSAREDQVALEDGENGLFTLMLSRGLKATGGKTSLYSMYKDHLENQVPARSRELDPGYSQQPSFARAGRGDAISF